MLFVLLFCISCNKDKGLADINTLETAEEVISLLNDDKVIVLDVRTLDEFDRGNLENSINMDVVNNSNFVADISKFNKNDVYLVYCARGTRSQMACSIMLSLGFKNIYNSAAGYSIILAALENVE